MARSKSARKTPSKKSKGKAAAADMPVSASLALNITRFYSMAFFVGTTIFTDQLAAGYGVPVSDANKCMMVFLGLNGFFAQGATNTFVGRLAHKKTMSLVCLANVVTFLLWGLHQAKGEFVDEVAFSTAVGMPANMSYFNIAQNVALVAINYMGWVASGSAMPSKPDFSNVSEMNKFNYVTIATCLFFGVMSYFMTDALFAMYNFDPTGDGAVMNKELMQGMGLSLLGNALRNEMVIQGGDKKNAYSNVRAGLFYYMLTLGMMMFQPFAASAMGMTAEENFAPRVADFVRNFGVMMWGMSIMTKHD